MSQVSVVVSVTLGTGLHSLYLTGSHVSHDLYDITVKKLFCSVCSCFTVNFNLPSNTT